MLLILIPHDLERPSPRIKTPATSIRALRNVREAAGGVTGCAFLTLDEASLLDVLVGD